MQGAGYLAIWSDVAPQDRPTRRTRITREHAAGPVGVTGFLACRIFRALGASVNRYFISTSSRTKPSQAVRTIWRG